MQREEVCVVIGPLTVRLLQRPPQVPPTVDDAGAAGDGPPDLAVRPASQGNGALESALLPVSDCLLGWELWPAASTLALYLASPEGRQLLHAAERVVELGAGLGLPGIVAAALGAAHVTLTDLPQALPLAAANARLNGVAGTCTAAPLDWGEVARLAQVRAGDGSAAAQAGAARPELGAPGEAERSCEAGGANGKQVAAAEEEAGVGAGPQAGVGAGGRPRQPPPRPAQAPQGQPPPLCQHLGAYDLVLAADVVYVSALAPLLADTIAAVCRGPPQALTPAAEQQQVLIGQHKGGAAAAGAGGATAWAAGPHAPHDGAASDGNVERGRCGGSVGDGRDAKVLVAHTTRKSVWLDRSTGEVRTDETDEPWERFLGCMRKHGFRWQRVDVDGRRCEESFVGVFTRGA